MVCYRFVDINSSFVPVLCLSVLVIGKLVILILKCSITFYLLVDIIFMHWVYISLDPFIAKLFGYNFIPIFCPFLMTLHKHKVI